MATTLGAAAPQKRSSTDVVADAVRSAIMSGEIAPGERLRQEQLCEALAVSPGPVREALRRLEGEGLVEHVANRGVSVITVTDRELREVILPVRLALETAAIRESLRDGGQEYIEQLSARMDEIRAAAASGSLAEANEADIQFHRLAVERSSSIHLKQLWRSVTPRLRAQFARLGRRHGSLQDIVDEHQVLLDAIESRHRGRIDEVLHDHVVESTERLLATRDPRSDQ